MTPIVFYKERSIKSCLTDAWKVTSLNWKNYLFTLLPMLIFAGGADALFIDASLRFFLLSDFPALFFLNVFSWNGIIMVIMAMPKALIFYLIVTILLCGISHLLLFSHLVRLIRDYSKKDTISRIRGLRINREEWPCLWRTMWTFLSFGLIICLSSIMIIAIAFKYSLLILFILPILLLYLHSAYRIHSIGYALFYWPLKRSIVYSLKHAFGLGFILQILVIIPIGCAVLICDLPILVYVLSLFAELQNVALGDISTSSLHLSVICIPICALFTFLRALFLSCRVLPLTLKIAPADKPYNN